MIHISNIKLCPCVPGIFSFVYIFASYYFRLLQHLCLITDKCCNILMRSYFILLHTLWYTNIMMNKANIFVRKLYFPIIIIPCILVNNMQLSNADGPPQEPAANCTESCKLVVCGLLRYRITSFTWNDVTVIHSCIL